jgi:hypothetical protein
MPIHFPGCTSVYALKFRPRSSPWALLYSRVLCISPKTTLLLSSVVDPDPQNFATSGFEIFLVETDPDLNRTYYRGIFEGTPTPTRYSCTDEVHLRGTYGCSHEIPYTYEVLHLQGTVHLQYEVQLDRRIQATSSRSIYTPKTVRVTARPSRFSHIHEIHLYLHLRVTGISTPAMHSCTFLELFINEI